MLSFESIYPIMRMTLVNINSNLTAQLSLSDLRQRYGDGPVDKVMRALQKHVKSGLLEVCHLVAVALNQMDSRASKDIFSARCNVSLMESRYVASVCLCYTYSEDCLYFKT